MPGSAIGPSEFVSLVSDTAIYSGGGDGDVGGLSKVDAGPIAEVDGTFYTLFVASGDRSGGGSENALYSATSLDGSSWTVSDSPTVLSGFEGGAELMVRSLIPLDDGSWVAYLHLAVAVGEYGNYRYDWSIQRAVAEDPAGPWTLDDEANLLPGGAGSWDSNGVLNPSVVFTGDRWMMFYTGFPSKEDRDGTASNFTSSALGLATSDDGISWTKLGDPVFTGDASVGWEEGSISRTEVLFVDDQFVLLYAARAGGTRGVATSPNGVVWARSEANPILTTLDTPRPTIYSTSMYQGDAGIRLYVSSGGEYTTSAVYEMSLQVP
ncbi:MAG: hypothetical protein BMS9Abin17_0360 [Acidimicrobiia bacterium]|nr:MAG: hypothetical protein BMS9Abin17_0360 [Acidimicrobiia bacterium]